MLREIGQAERQRVTDQFAEQPVTGGKRAHRLDLLGSEPHGDELHEGTVLPDHPEGAVPRVDQVGRCLHDSAQHLRKAEFAAHRQHGLEQAVQSVLPLACGVEANLQFVQKFVEPELRQVLGPRAMLPAHRTLLGRSAPPARSP